MLSTLRKVFSVSGHEICTPCYTEVMKNETDCLIMRTEAQNEDSEDEFADAMEELKELVQDMINPTERDVMKDLSQEGNESKFSSKENQSTEMFGQQCSPNHTNSVKLIYQKPVPRFSSDCLSSNENDLEDWETNFSDGEEYLGGIEKTTENGDIEGFAQVNEVGKIEGRVNNKHVDDENTSESEEPIDEFPKKRSTRLKYKPIVCPIESCWMFVSVSELVKHFAFDHPKIPRSVLRSNQTATVFVSNEYVQSGIVKQVKIFIIKSFNGDTNEDCDYFVLNVTKQCFGGKQGSLTSLLEDKILVWVSEIKFSMVPYDVKIRAVTRGRFMRGEHALTLRNKTQGQSVSHFSPGYDKEFVVSRSQPSYFGPVSTHQDPLAVFQYGHCLVIPMSIFDGFTEDCAKGFDLTLTFSFAEH
ncbi:hypothetical protein WDU94_003642 [Cyamophila willieti]